MTVKTEGCWNWSSQFDADNVMCRSAGKSTSSPVSDAEQQRIDAEARMKKAEEEEAAKKRQAEQEIEDMMAELKGKLKSKDR